MDDNTYTIQEGDKNYRVGPNNNWRLKQFNTVKTSLVSALVDRLNSKVKNPFTETEAFKLVKKYAVSMIDLQ